MSKLHYNDLALDRFGLVGYNKTCFWGLIGIQWVTPLPVFQLNLGNISAPVDTSSGPSTYNPSTQSQGPNSQHSEPADEFDIICDKLGTKPCNHPPRSEEEEPVSLIDIKGNQL